MHEPTHHAQQQPQTRVAIIGTGLAGLTTAYLLQSDKRKRYSITLFEQADTLSFDAASVAVKNNDGVVERVDVPMRATAGGYYHHSMRMYRHLGIPLHPVRFLFVFAKAATAALAGSSSKAARPAATANGRRQSRASGADEKLNESIVGSDASPYFIHASNLHQTPPPWPGNRGVVVHLVEIAFLILCHFWFSVACALVPPRSASAHSDRSETFAEYLQRIRLPRRYASQYLVPLMSSVSTCTHDQLLDYPASDMVTYKKLSHGQQHYVVCGGVEQVQSALAKGIEDVRLRRRVVEVAAREDGAGGSLIRWQTWTDDGLSGEVAEEAFDRVVLAVSPDVAGRLYRPLADMMPIIPTARVKTAVLSPSSTHPQAYSVVDTPTTTQCMHHTTEDMSTAQIITLKTQFSSQSSARTEALHTMPSGVVVQTCPLEDVDPKRALRAAEFTRTLRSTESQALINKIMREPKGHSPTEADGWVNGQDNVWLAGAWCWDGMVLLEGCVVSAMRVANDFGVRIPWI